MISGASLNGTTLTINGTGFGTKANPKPLVVADFSTGLNPSNLGQLTSWDHNQSMTWNATEGVNGGGCAKSSNDSGVWTLGVNSPVALNPYNGTAYLFQKRRRNFSLGINGQPTYVNWKEARIFAAFGAIPGDNTNHYWSPSNGGIGLEGFAPPFGVTESFPYSYWPNNRLGITQADTQGSDSDWYINEIVWKTNSAATLVDGKFWINVNNKEVGKLPDIGDGSGMKFMLRNKDASTNDMKVFFMLQGVEGSESKFIGTNAAIWFDYGYMDNTAARVMIGDNLDFTKCTKDALYPLPPSAWSDTGITVDTMGITGGFVHVIDSNNLTVGSLSISGAQPAPTPTGTTMDLKDILTGHGYVSLIKDSVNGLRGFSSAYKWNEAPTAAARVAQFRGDITRLDTFWNAKTTAEQTAFNTSLGNLFYKSSELDSARISLTTKIGPDLDAISVALSSVKAKPTYDAPSSGTLDSAMKTLITDINSITLVSTSLL